MINMTDLQVGQRVAREDSGEMGTIVEVDGGIKVKWDSRRTSYTAAKNRPKLSWWRSEARR